MIQNGSRIYLIEIKSGNDFKKHASITKAQKADNWNISKSYVFCKGNIETNDSILYLLWYEIMFLKSDDIPYNTIFELDLSELDDV